MFIICDYCGGSFTTKKCTMDNCTETFFSCDCDWICDNHQCSCCGDIFDDLDDFGECEECRNKNVDTDLYHNNDIIGLG